MRTTSLDLLKVTERLMEQNSPLATLLATTLGQTFMMATSHDAEQPDSHFRQVFEVALQFSMLDPPEGGLCEHAQCGRCHVHRKNVVSK